MQKKYGKNLVAVTVDLDEPGDKNLKQKVVKILTKIKAAQTTNLILDEKPEVWQKKLKIEGPPVVIVFDRSGKLVKKYDEGQGYDEISKYVVKLLEE
ncbi:MAG: hypothetical protein KatS3mg105_0568 [Gemmatales bacterium]|nr:MAG: hypothetical protein KatS3mg105_0568 [Gemmatales bacterium]